MSAPLTPQGTDCCTPCPNPVVSQVPGPTGATGAAGTSGTSGKDAFTVSTANFSAAPFGLQSQLTVADTSWMIPGQVIVIEQCGYFQVFGSPVDATHVNVTNLGYPGNVGAGPPHVAPLKVSPGGFIGVTGASGVSTLNGVSPTTTKGDLIVDNGANSPNASDVRLGVGADGTVLTARSGQPTGVQWSGIDLTGAATTLSGALPIANGGTSQTTRQAALNALAPTGPATGDLLRYDGANWSRIARGTASQLLSVNGAGTDIAWATLTGTVLQKVSTSSATYSNFSTTIPWDDTIPQSAEGTQILTASITPLSATSTILVRVSVPLFTPTSNSFATIALFNGAANAVAANTVVSGITVINNIHLDYFVAPGSTSAITFSVRMGMADGNPLYLNGTNVSRFLGGVCAYRMFIAEYA